MQRHVKNVLCRAQYRVVELNLYVRTVTAALNAREVTNTSRTYLVTPATHFHQAVLLWEWCNVRTTNAVQLISIAVISYIALFQSTTLTVLQRLFVQVLIFVH